MASRCSCPLWRPHYDGCPYGVDTSASSTSSPLPDAIPAPQFQNPFTLLLAALQNPSVEPPIPTRENIIETFANSLIDWYDDLPGEDRTVLRAQYAAAGQNLDDIVTDARQRTNIFLLGPPQPKRLPRVPPPPPVYGPAPPPESHHDDIPLSRIEYHDLAPEPTDDQWEAARQRPPADWLRERIAQSPHDEDRKSVV